jgi:DNA primase
VSDDPILDEIRARLVSPPRVLAALGIEGEREGNTTWKICCPWHDEKTPSCSVRVGPEGSLQVHCFGCGKTGDVFHLIAARHGLSLPGDFHQAKRVGAELCNLSLDSSPRTSTPRPRPVTPPAPPPPGPPNHAELAFDRGCRLLLSLCPLDGQLPGTVGAGLAFTGLLEEARAAGWGELPAEPLHLGAEEAKVAAGGGFDTTDLSRAELAGRLLGHRRDLRWLLKLGNTFAHPEHRLLIPWRSPDGRINELQRRYAPRNGTGREAPPAKTPKYVFASREDYSPQARYAYGVDRKLELDQADEIFLVEGAVDAIAIRALVRLENQVRAEFGKAPLRIEPLGLPGVTSWKQVGSSVLPFLAGKVVQIGFDNDDTPKPGVEAAVELVNREARRAGARAVKRALPPDGHKDWAEYLAAKVSRPTQYSQEVAA